MHVLSASPTHQLRVEGGKFEMRFPTVRVTVRCFIWESKAKRGRAAEKSKSLRRTIIGRIEKRITVSGPFDSISQIAQHHNRWYKLHGSARTRNQIRGSQDEVSPSNYTCSTLARTARCYTLYLGWSSAKGFLLLSQRRVYPRRHSLCGGT